MPADGNTHHRMKLDEGTVVHTEIEIVGYLDEEKGDIAVGVRVEGEYLSNATTVGLIEEAKHLILRSWEEQLEDG